MPGKTIRFDSVEAEWDLEPLKGLKSFVVVPKIISLASMLVYAAGRAEIDLSTLITDDGFNWESLKVENVLAFRYIADEVVENWDLISKEILPELLHRPHDWLNENGTPLELMTALWNALSYHAESIFGEDVWGALKKLNEEAEGEQEMDSEQNET